MDTVGVALVRGSLRLPLHLKFEGAFDVALVAADGNEAVRASAEILEHAGHATWIRFKSADPSDDEADRCILADVDVDVTAPEDAVVQPVAPQGSEAFEAITAVSERPAALDAVPSGKAEAVPLLPPPPEIAPVSNAPDSISAAVLSVESESADAPGTVESRPSEAMTAPIPIETMAEVIESKPVASSGELFESKTEEVQSPAIVGESIIVEANIEGASNALADAVTTEDAEAIDVNDTRDTEASPPIMLAHGKDAVARERGIEPIAEPYVRESQPVIPQDTPKSRRVVIASVSFAAACLAISGVAIVWAQDAVAQAKPVANEAPVFAQAVAQEPVKEVDRHAGAPQTPTREVDVEQTTSGMCKLSIDASVPDSRVTIDKKDRGLTPLSTSVPCGQPIAIEVRHARYAAYERTITVTAADETLHAKLEREKTTVTLTSDPPAAVTVNGVPIGKTPMRYTAPRFEQSTFRFSAPGYETDWRRIHPKTDTSTVILKLEPQR